MNSCTFLISCKRAAYPTNLIILDLFTKIIFGASHTSRAVRDLGPDRSDMGIVSSNLAQGMDVCPRLFVLCCPE
jgi:hypothetical protein